MAPRTKEEKEKDKFKARVAKVDKRAEEINKNPGFCPLLDRACNPECMSYRPAQGYQHYQLYILKIAKCVNPMVSLLNNTPERRTN